MKKSSLNSNGCIDKMVVAPFIAIRMIDQSSYLLFDSKITADSTRTLRMLALPSLSEGVFAVEQGSVDGTVYRFRVSFQPQTTTQNGIMEIAMITIDFNAGPFTGDGPAPDAETCDKWAAYFLSKLRNCVLDAFAKAIKDSAVPLNGTGNDLSNNPSLREDAYQYAPTEYLVHNHKLMSPPSRSSSLNWGKWLGGSAIALCAVLFSIIMIKIFIVPSESGSARDPSNVIANVGQIQQDILAAGLRGAQNPGDPGSILGPNITEQTLKSMGLDPGKAAANMGCLAR